MSARPRRSAGVGDLGAGVDLVDVAASGKSIGEAHTRDTLQAVAVGDLRPSPHQPATRGDDAAVADLAENIGAHGILQPLLARRLADGSLELIAGHRRLAAARRAGLATVPVRVQRDVSDLDAQERTLAENLARTDLTPWEEAQGIAALRAARQRAGAPHAQRDLARAAGWSAGRVAESLLVAERVPVAVATAAGVDAQTLSTLPKTALVAIAQADEAQRPELLRAAVQSAAPGVAIERATGRGKAGKASDGKPWTARVRLDGPCSVALRVPVAELAPDEARALARALAPLVQALRARGVEGRA